MKSAFAVLAVTALSTAQLSTARADVVELRLATLAPGGSKWMQAFEKGAAETAKATEKRVSVIYYPGGEQGDERDFISKIKLGQLDGAAVTAVGLSMIDESIRVLELPMMFESIEEVDYVADKVWPYFQKKFEDKGFRLEARGEVGWVHFMSKAEVKSLADLRKQKLWIWGDDRLVGAMFKKLNISGVALGVPEVDPALTTGRIDACYGSPLAAVALQWHTKIRYMTSLRMSYAIGATVISLQALKKLTPADSKSVFKVAGAIGKKLRVSIRKENESAQRTMTRKGVTISATPEVMSAEFNKHAQELWKSLVGKMYTQAELDMVLAARAEYRKAKPAAVAPTP
ncbi:MAG TPA: TRAP transporter substrate-binding protein DctP [Kofleriaceae bacterium]|nr:TRAP transporter substrate-binding protein DctP [Kofleriaceae bacterium]